MVHKNNLQTNASQEHRNIFIKIIENIIHQYGKWIKLHEQIGFIPGIQGYLYTWKPVNSMHILNKLQ